MQRKDYRGARPLLEDALRASPEDLRAVTALLGTYSLSKEFGAGLLRVQEHVARYPQSAPLQQYSGELLLRNGRLSEARSAFQGAKKADASGIAADLSLARLDILDRNLDTARGILSRVISSHPSNADALLLIAEVEVMSNDFEHATRRYREILTRDKDNVVALNNLASVLSEKMARADEAIPYARHAIELAPENADARDTLGWIYYTKKMYPAALTQLEAAAVKQRTARNQFRIAMVHRQIGNEKQSAEYLQRAVSLDPKILTEGQ